MGRKNCEALSDEDREARRAAERELMADAVAMLMTSEGWKRWLQVRRHFHAYSLLILSGGVVVGLRAGFARR